MNQILATNSQKPEKQPKQKSQATYKTSTPVDMARIARIFAIVLLVFGICVVATGSYAIYEAGETKGETAMVNPVITVENLEDDDTTLLLTVTSNIGIDKVVYRWNDGKQTTLNGKGSSYIEQKIQIATGSNILNITATDTQNQESTHSKRYELNSKIVLEAVENKVRVTYKGDTEIAYMTYRWDEEDEKQIDIDSNEIDEEIDVLSGSHTLTIVVVDVDNHTETRVKEIVGVPVPVIDVHLNDDNTKYVITVTDATNLQEIVLTLDEDETKKYGQKISGKEFKVEFPLKENSENKMKIEVTNSDNQSAERMVKFKK